MPIPITSIDIFVAEIRNKKKDRMRFFSLKIHSQENMVRVCLLQNWPGTYVRSSFEFFSDTKRFMRTFYSSFSTYFRT